MPVDSRVAVSADACADRTIAPVTLWRLWKSGRVAELIQPVQVIAETAQYVTYRWKDNFGDWFERRERKDGKFFATFDEAKQALLDMWRADMRYHQREAHSINSHIGQLRKLTEPTP
jgi:hypothetical protein